MPRITEQAKRATRTRIIAAACNLFQGKGFEQATTRDIAQAAGIATGTLFNYFPAAMRDTFPTDIAAHRLRREIIATVLANHAINRGGPGFVVSVCDATGSSPDTVVKAALVTREALGLTPLWDKIDACLGIGVAFVAHEETLPASAASIRALMTGDCCPAR